MWDIVFFNDAVKMGFYPIQRMQSETGVDCKGVRYIYFGAAIELKSFPLINAITTTSVIEP